MTPQHWLVDFLMNTPLVLRPLDLVCWLAGAFVAGAIAVILKKR